MKNFFYKLSLKLDNFMRGRYGSDKLSRFMLLFSASLMILSLPRVLRFLYFVGLFIMLLSILRSLSRNFAARRKELDAYLKIERKITGRISLSKRKWNERKTHKYFRCPKCKAVLRVPKGKGKINITCTKCKHKFDKKS